MEFLDVKYLAGGGTFGIPMFGAHYTNPSDMVLRIENDLVLRVVGNASDAYCVATLTVGAETVAVTLRFNVSKTQYLPVNDILAALFQRSLVTTLQLVGTSGTLVLETFDSSDVSRGSDSLTLKIYDSGGYPETTTGYPFAQLLPESFRFLKVVNNNACMVVRCIEGARTFTVYNSSGTALQTFTHTAVDGASVGAQLKWSATPSSVPSYVVAKDGNGMELERARVEFSDGCGTDEVQLTWWSNVDGGYKSRAAKVRRDSRRVVSSQDWLQMFSTQKGARSAGGLSVVFENLTPRDMRYYCDILTSDYVFVNASFMASVGSFLRVPVVVRGDFPTFDAVRAVDLPFDIEFLHTDNI